MNSQLSLFDLPAFTEWTSSRADILASHSLTLVEGAVPKIHVTSGLTCTDSSENYTPLGLLRKTLEDTLPSDSMRFSWIWKERATKQGHSYLQLVQSGHRTKGNGSSSLDTARLWSPPQAGNGAQGPKSKEFYERCLVTNESCITLTDQARHEGLWRPPQARDWKGPQGRSYRNESADLPSMVMWPTPTSRDYKDTGDCANVPTNSLLVREVSPSKAEGSLNPDWVESLMGFPPGWTDVGPQVRKNRNTNGKRHALRKESQTEQRD